MIDSGSTAWNSRPTHEETPGAVAHRYRSESPTVAGVGAAIVAEQIHVSCGHDNLANVKARGPKREVRGVAQRISRENEVRRASFGGEAHVCVEDVPLWPGPVDVQDVPVGVHAHARGREYTANDEGTGCRRVPTDQNVTRFNIVCVNASPHQRLLTREQCGCHSIVRDNHHVAKEATQDSKYGTEKGHDQDASLNDEFER